MSVDCNIDEDIEYLDEILVFSRETHIDQDFIEFSQQLSCSSGDSGIIGMVTSSDSMDSGVPNANDLKTFDGSPRSVSTREKKKKSRFVPGKHTSVTKNDIRRRIAQMYIDALNSGNIPIFRKSINDFATPDCVVVTRNISSSGMFLPSVVEARGVEAICGFYDAFIKSSPDSTFELHSSSIRVFSDGTSSISCKYTLNATKVFSVAGLEENAPQKVVLSLDPMEDLTKQFGRAQLNANVTTTVDDPVTGSQTEVQTKVKVSLGEVLKNKSKLAICGTISLFLNADKRVFHIDFAMADLNEQRERERLQQQQVGGFVGGSSCSSVESGTTVDCTSSVSSGSTETPQLY